MCKTCDRQERVCPNGHIQPKRHGDVFNDKWTECEICGEQTEVRDIKD